MSNDTKSQPSRSWTKGPRLKLVGVAIVLVVLAFGIVVSRRQTSSATAATPEAIGVRLASPTAATRVTLEDCLALLAQSTTGYPALTDAVRGLIDEARSTGRIVTEESLAVLLVSYRERSGSIQDLVVQIFQTPVAGSVSVLNPDGVVRARLGEDLFGSAENLLQLLYHPVINLGDQKAVARHERALAAAIEGDLTFLREQTVEPLRVLVVMPSAEKYLPGSLRTRVQSIVLDSELTFGEWRSQVAMIAGNEQAAQQVGNTLAAWREIANTLAGTYAKHSSGLPLRQSLEDTRVEVRGDRVITAAKVPSLTMVRVTKEIAGHGGQRGCSHGFYKKSGHWPSGITHVQLGCQSYTKEQCLNLLVQPARGDASISLAHELIAAKINRVVGLPATPAQIQAITDADALLCSYTGRLPYNVPASSPAGQQMVALATILEAYNNSCHTNGGGGDTGGGPSEGCQPSYYTDISHWPSGTTKLPLGCRVYTQTECVNLLNAVPNGDASLVLASQLIAAKLNRLVGLPATTEQIQVISSADDLYCTFPGKLPYAVSLGSPAGVQMTALAASLEVYNHSCQSAGTPSDNGSGLGAPKGNNGLGNGVDPQPPGNPPINDGAGTQPGAPGSSSQKGSKARTKT